MRGHIKKRGDSWYVVIYMGPHPETGKPRYKWHSVKGEREDAERYLTEILRQIDTHTYVDPSKLTVKEYLQQWVRDYCEIKLAKSTLTRYKGIVDNHLIPALGHHKIAKLQPTHIQAHYAETLKNGRKDGKGEKLSPTTVLQHHRVLSEALKHAVKWGILARNVCEAVDPPRKAKPEFAVLEKEELEYFLQQARDHNLYIPIAISAYTGMRRGEVLGLRWKDIDLKGGIIHVKQSVELDKDTKEYAYKPTKNEQSRRVDMQSKLVEILKSWREQQKKNKKEYGKDPDKESEYGKEYIVSDLVCTMPDGRMISLDHCTKGTIKLARRCRLNISFHDLRHTHATLMLKANLPVKLVAERLGHSVKVCMDTYAHVLPSMQRDAIQKLEGLID